MVEKELEAYARTYAHEVKEAGRIEEFLRTWIRGVATGLKEMDEETARRVLKECGENCCKIFLEVYGLDLASHDLDSLIAALDRGLATTGTRCERRGDIILYEFKPEQCECPLVSENLVELTPRLCSACFTNWLEYLFGTVSKRAVRVQLIQSLATGAEKCTFRIRLEPIR
jgi:predicted hydrocarbon binding protein